MKSHRVGDGERSLAVFIDFENMGLGFNNRRDRFEIAKVLERLVEKGKIVCKKAYADWSRFGTYTGGLHEAAIELIEIPRRRQAGKNSADIRMVVDAMDLCVSKGHIDTFALVTGDSDFSPLVSKLRENAKVVIGVGVKNSTSDLLIANCDEFIYYDDLVRAKRKSPAKKAVAKATGNGVPAPKRGTDDDRTQEALELAVETVEALIAERGDEERIWGSMVKQALRRRNPGFNESFYGYRSFNALLEDAAKRGLLALDRDEKSANYLVHLLAPEE
jgi:uncharacterized protein (TIGR00288 family)